MKTNKITIALLALFAFSSANAEYVIKIAVDKNAIKMINVEPQSNEHICTATGRYVQEFTNNKVNAVGGWNDNSNICYVSVYGIDKIETLEEYQNIGNYILSLAAGKYTIDTSIYGYSDGLGRAMIWNGTVAKSSWHEKN
ncbi:hypothetical protein OL210_006577 [Pseudomonas aeruginosa]|nr:hypothetical protein [Pseudomonas aeruginosa]EKW6798570.1 hypothetical protein [Pseudomonas aeruginosa]